jgi:hypothetical protein
MKKLVAMAVMLAVMLAVALPASADETASVGNWAADVPTGLPFGTDVAAAGNPVPPNAFALGVNDPFEVNFALGGVGPVQDDVIAGSEFLGTNFATGGPGNVNVDVEDDFFD